jgi:hypothetical protein
VCAHRYTAALFLRPQLWACQTNNGAAWDGVDDDAQMNAGDTSHSDNDVAAAWRTAALVMFALLVLLISHSAWRFYAAARTTRKTRVCIDGGLAELSRSN